jgi:WD40 repeat protein
MFDLLGRRFAGHRKRRPNNLNLAAPRRRCTFSVDRPCELGRKVRILPDGTLLASISYDKTLRLWHIPSGRCHCALGVAAG